MKLERSVRKSQVISPFGPGGIFDFGDESFIALDISQWKINKCRIIRLGRLENLLSVSQFIEPPIPPQNMPPDAVNPDVSVPYMRFPSWLFCPNCRRMLRWGWEKEVANEQPRCPQCGPKSRLAPMRFMAVCADGHLSDINWGRWAHSHSEKRCENHKLEFISDAARGGGLQSLIVRCITCDQSKNLERLVESGALGQIGISCPGRHPWQRPEQAVACDKKLQVVQRGASNAYFPVVTSALDIRVKGDNRPEGYYDVTGHASWGTLKALYCSSTSQTVDDVMFSPIIDIISDGTGVSKDIVKAILAKECGKKDEEVQQKIYEGEEELIREEWKILIDPPTVSQGTPFAAEMADLDSFEQELPGKEKETWREFRKAIEKLVLVKRIRIVRAFTGFRRLDPSGEMQSPGMGKELGWLPAVEVFGEGIFLSLNMDQLKTWEASIPSAYANNYYENYEKSGYTFLPEPSPRFVLLHTLAHILIRQLCFECGYSSSSLTERIYCDNTMAGILIYTASSDSEGALGGLVREAHPERFYGILKTALFRSQWCSNDPICSELPHQGIRGLNKAACHACTLVAETSCAHANALLDRSTVYGHDGMDGYFHDFVLKIGE